jgi:hypothetical protein
MTTTIGGVMKDKLSKQIRELMDKSKHGVVEISVNTFVRAWGSLNAKKLIEFAEKNEFGYVSILRGNRIIAIRFWRLKGTELLEEKNEGEGTDRESEGSE